MSLPDTVFIFVLALIIFGPKKLPEIGRQIGRLVGEFRRASNEFKFQIEEELRQVDFNEKRSERQTITSPKDDAMESEPEQESDLPTASAAGLDLAEKLPVGQHPSIDNLDLSTLNDFNSDTANAKEILHSNGDDFAAASESVAPLNVTAAAGSEPRRSIPYANAAPSEAGTANANSKPEQPNVIADDEPPGSPQPADVLDNSKTSAHTSVTSTSLTRG